MHVSNVEKQLPAAFVIIFLCTFLNSLLHELLRISASNIARSLAYM